MAVKTDALQQNAAPKAADTLLMAASAGGTAQLTLANLAKFLTEQDNAVKTALSNKAALSAQQTVEQNTVSTRSVTVTAAELPGYIKSLPRLLTEVLIVTAEQGTVPSGLELDGFYGLGALYISGNDSVLNGGIRIQRCGAYVNLTHFDVRGTCTVNGGPVAVYSALSPNVAMSHIIIDGSRGSVDRAELTGVRCDDCGMTLMQEFQISDVDTAVLITGASLAAADGFDCSGNKVGAYTYRGGMLMLIGSTPDLLGGGLNVKGGGVIFNKNGVLL